MESRDEQRLLSDEVGHAADGTTAQVSYRVLTRQNFTHILGILF
jgi:hypothetical protein